MFLMKKLKIFHQNLNNKIILNYFEHYYGNYINSISNNCLFYFFSIFFSTTNYFSIIIYLSIYYYLPFLYLSYKPYIKPNKNS